VQTGRLVFSLETYIEGIKTEWHDQRQAAIETQLKDILSGIVVAFALLAQQRREGVEAERREREEERQRQIEAEKRQKERNQRRRLVELAKVWQEVQAARRFLAALRERGASSDAPIDGRTLPEWFSWAEELLSRHDPMGHGARAVFEDLSRVGRADEHHQH